MKIIATDYDGTLNHKGIDDKKKTAVSRWRKAGNLFGVVSGRGIRALHNIVDEKGFEYDFLIANNGAVICDKDFNIITEARGDGSVCKSFIEDMFGWGCEYVNIDKDISIFVIANEVERENDEIILSELPDIDYFNQMNTSFDSVDEAARIVALAKDKYGSVINPLQNGTCIDFTPAGVDKAVGIYSLLKAMGGEYGDVITVGDNINDEAMIKEFRSYAMANGVQYIKDIANGITEGITELIETEMASTED